MVEQHSAGLPEIVEGDETRQRILDAAEGIFADSGYEAATVRQVCERAGVKNIGAINYYFRGKENLYAETVKLALRCCSEGMPFPELSPATPPVEKLKSFIHVLINRLMQAPRLSAMKLMTREFADPSPACREAVLQNIQPMANMLSCIVGELLPEVSQEKRWLIGFSIVGQCLYYRQNRSVVEILVGREIVDRFNTAVLAEHITNFTLAALGFAQPVANREEK